MLLFENKTRVNKSEHRSRKIDAPLENDVEKCDSRTPLASLDFSGHTRWVGDDFFVVTEHSKKESKKKTNKEEEKKTCTSPSHNVPVLGLAVQLRRLRVHQVPDARRRVQVEHGFELFADGHLGRFVGGGASPQRDAVLFGAHAHHDAAHFVTLGKLFADAGEQGVEPHGVEGGFGRGPLGHEHGPLAAALARGILPLGFDPLLEAVQVAAVAQPGGGLDVVVEPG